MGKEIGLHLEDWQRNMLGHIYGKEAAKCDVWYIPVDDGMKTLYGVPVTSLKPAHRMYFTSWQKRLLADAAGSDCEYIELNPATAPKIFRYGLPTS